MASSGDPPEHRVRQHLGRHRTSVARPRRPSLRGWSGWPAAWMPATSRPGSVAPGNGIIALPPRPRVVFTGRLHPQKNIDLLIDIWPDHFGSKTGGIARAGRPRDPSETDSSERSRHPSGLTDRVHFAGDVADPADHLRAADAFALPSVAEGMSNSLLEAMSTALPCLASEIGGNTDLLEQASIRTLAPARRSSRPGPWPSFADLDRSARPRSGLGTRRPDAGSRPTSLWMPSSSRYQELYARILSGQGSVIPIGIWRRNPENGEAHLSDATVTTVGGRQESVELRLAFRASGGSMLLTTEPTSRMNTHVARRDSIDQPPSPPCPRLSAPIVLAHGLFGFRTDRTGPFDARLVLPRDSRDSSKPPATRVLVTRVHPTAGVARRSRKLGELIQAEFPRPAGPPDRPQHGWTRRQSPARRPILARPNPEPDDDRDAASRLLESPTSPSSASAGFTRCWNGSGSTTGGSSTSRPRAAAEFNARTPGARLAPGVQRRRRPAPRRGLLAPPPAPRRA